MAKPRAGRHVSRASAALASTNRPITDAALASPPSSGGGGTADRLRWNVKTGVALDGLINAIAGTGTSRDKRTGNAYVRDRITDIDLEAIYSSSWLAGAIIDTLPDDGTRAGWTRTWDGADDNQDSVKKVRIAEKNIGLRAKVNEAWKWGRLYGDCKIVMGVGNENLALPLDVTKVKKGSLQYLHVMDARRIFPGSRVDDNNKGNNPNFGKPLTFMIVESSVEVHWTRVVSFGGRNMPYFVKRQNAQGWREDSILQRVADAVKNFDASDAAVATMMFDASVDVHLMEGLKEQLAEDNGEEKVAQRMLLAQTMKSVWKTLTLDGGRDGVGGDKFQQKTIAFAGIDHVMDRMATNVAGAARMPVSVLFGEPPKGMNATGEHNQKNWYDAVTAAQETDVAPQLNQLDQVFIRSTLGFMPENYELTFNSLFQMDPKEQAAIEKLQAERDKIYFDMGAITEGLIARELKARGTYVSMEKKDVDLAEEMAARPEPTPPALPSGNADNQPADNQPLPAE